MWDVQALVFSIAPCALALLAPPQESRGDVLSAHPERVTAFLTELSRMQGDMRFHVTEHTYLSDDGSEDALDIEGAVRQWVLDAKAGKFPTFHDGIAASRGWTSGPGTYSMVLSREATIAGGRILERTVQ